mgnify:CR=1 FL=1
MNRTIVRRLAACAAIAMLALGPLQAAASGHTGTIGQAAPTPTPSASPTAAAGAAAAPAAAAAPPPAGPAPSGHATVATIPAGFDKTSENSSLALYVEKPTGQIAVQDKRNGMVWLSNPRLATPPASTGPASSAQQETAAVYWMQYTDYQRQVPKLLNSAWDPTPPVISKLPDGGTRVRFTPSQQLKDAPITFAMDYHLYDGYFDVTIPQDQIKESINDAKQVGFYLVTLEPLPFFGSGADDEQGYMLVPDGSGALVNFKPIHPDYLQPFNQEVYASDTFFFDPQGTNVQQYFVPQEPVMLPAFGIAKQADSTAKTPEGAFLGLVTQGDSDVFMDVWPSGYITKYNHTGAQFLYRRTANIPRSRGVTVQRVAIPMVTGDKTVRYYLLGGQGATYSGMAAKYRDYLLNDKHVPQLAQADAPLQLDLIMGAQKNGLVGQVLVQATTFSEAQQIIEALRERGVTRLDVTLRGWNRDGLRRASPNRMPADTRLGGNAGMEQLTSMARQLGVPIYLLDDFRTAYSGEKGYFAHNDAVRGANKLPTFSSGVGQGQQLYLLSPVVEYNNFVLRDVPKEKLLGASGLDLDYFGKIITYDTNDAHLLTRQGYIDWNNKITDYVRQELGNVSVEGGNPYMLPHSQNLRQVSVDDSHYQFEDQAVPFYEMVMHGLATYTGKYANLRSDPQFEYLRQLEYGAQPAFNLTYLPTSELYRAYSAYENFSSTWTDWVDDLVREYQDETMQLGSTTNQFIIDHRQLAPGVFQTTYQNGTKVIVNYSDQRYSNGVVAVSSLGYVVTH